MSRRGGGFDENLTSENKKFLDDLILDKYANPNSPLRSAPWKKGTFDPEGMYSTKKKSYYRNTRLGVLAIKLGSIPQWTKSDNKVYTTLLQVRFGIFKQ